MQSNQLIILYKIPERNIYEVVPTDMFLEEAARTVGKAEKKGMILRIMGGLAIAIHSQEFRKLARKPGRTGTGVVKGQEYSDIDFMSYRKDLFGGMGYAKRKATLSSASSERQIYYSPKRLILRRHLLRQPTGSESSPGFLKETEA